VSTPPWLSKLLFIVAAVLFVLAAITASGTDIFHADATAWFYGGLAALALGLAAS
jgi:hypothetical protein